MALSAKLRSLHLANHPRGIWLIVVTEFWERFSYYAMTGMFVLFLVTPIAGGGFGWGDGDALRLLGAYTAVVYLTPLLGGLLGDRVLGPRRSLTWGVALQALGHLMMVGPAIVPWALERATGVPVDHVLGGAAVPLGGILDASEVDRLRAALGPGAAPGALDVVMLGYHGVTASFYAALAVLTIGVGLAKSNALVILSRLYEGGAADRDVGFTLFYGATNVGAMVSNFVAGTIGERFGWHYGFSAAGLGMVGGLALYLALQRRLFGSVAADIPAKTAAGTRPRAQFDASERDGLRIVAMLSLFMFLYFIAYQQIFGLINLFIHSSVDKSVGGFGIPTTWFQSLNPMLVIILVPLIVPLLDRLSRRGVELDQATKFSFGFVMLSLGFALMCGATLDVASAPDGRATLWWVVGALALITIGEVVMAPGALASANRYAPRRIASLTVAGFLATIAVGSWASGQVGALVETVEPMMIFGGIGLLCLASAAFALFLRRYYRRWTRQAAAAAAELPSGGGTVQPVQ